MDKAKRWTLIAAALAVGAAVCFTAGRVTAPTQTRETKTATETKAVTTVATVEAAQATITVHDTVTKYIDRVVTRPDGTKVETKTSTVEAKQEAEAKTEKRETQARVEVQTKTVTVDRLVTLKPRAPRFAPGVFVSSGLDLKPHYGAEFGVRVVGPAWLTAGADVKARAAFLRLSLVF